MQEMGWASLDHSIPWTIRRGSGSQAGLASKSHLDGIGAFGDSGLPDLYYTGRPLPSPDPGLFAENQ